MVIRCVVFDIGGVLEFTPSTGWVERWEADLGLLPGEVEARLGDVFAAGELGRVTEAAVATAVAERLALAPTQVEAFLGDLWTEYLGTPNQELTEWFRALRPRYRTTLLSNSFVGAREKEQEAYGYAQLVDVVVYSHEVGLAKPDPQIYALAARLAAVQPTEVLFLDDTLTALEGAQEAGWTTVLFQETAQAIEELEAHLQGTTR